MYPATTVAKALELVRAGWTVSAVSRSLGVSRAAIRCWVALGAAPTGRHQGNGREGCPACRHAYAEIPSKPYAYLLGQYLGDGCLSPFPRGVYRLRIACATAWPGVTRECVRAIQAIRPDNAVGVQPHPTSRLAEVGSYSKHWVCLFPQHGPGPKHLRSIRLELWQQDIVSDEPGSILRGLFHSDGCRVLNRVDRYAYPRYFLSNMSTDIIRLAGDALDRIGVEWRYNRFNSISVARGASVARLDEVVGPKY